MCVFVCVYIYMCVCVCVCVCEINLTGEEEGVVLNWSVVVSPHSGLKICGQNLQFN